MFNRKYKKLRKIMEMSMEKYYRWFLNELRHGNEDKAHYWFSKYFALKDVLNQFDKS